MREKKQEIHIRKTSNNIRTPWTSRTNTRHTTIMNNSYNYNNLKTQAQIQEIQTINTLAQVEQLGA